MLMELIELMAQGIRPASFCEAVQARLELEDIEHIPDAVVRTMDEKMLEFETAERLLEI